MDNSEFCTCTKEHKINAVYCEDCGKRIKRKYCPLCGKENPTQASFCVWCGTNFESGYAPNTLNNETNISIPPVKNPPALPIVFAITALAAVLIAICYII